MHSGTPTARPSVESKLTDINSPPTVLESQPTNTWPQLSPTKPTEGSGLHTLDYSLLPSRQRTHWVSRAKGVQLPAPGVA